MGARNADSVVGANTAEIDDEVAFVPGAKGQVFQLNDVGECTATVTSNSTPVPEPGTWALLAVGFAALGFMRRKALRVVSPTA